MLVDNNKQKKMNDNNYIKATKYGKLYIETKDFFKIKKVQETIKKLLKSNIVKNIDINKNE